MQITPPQKYIALWDCASSEFMKLYYSLNPKRKTEAIIKFLINPLVPPFLYRYQSRALECSKGHALFCTNLVGKAERTDLLEGEVFVGLLTSCFLLFTYVWLNDADHFEQVRKHPQSTNLSLVQLGSMLFVVYACFVKGRINCISFFNRTGTIMPAFTFDQCVHIWVHIVCSVLLNSAQRRFILYILRIFPLLKITFHLICSN